MTSTRFPSVFISRSSSAPKASTTASAAAAATQASADSHNNNPKPEEYVVATEKPTEPNETEETYALTRDMSQCVDCKACENACKKGPVCIPLLLSRLGS